MKKKRSKQPPRKIHLVFDERERREFLTGFQKRKKERQKKAQEKLMQEAKEEKRRLKAEKREILQRLLGDKPVPGSTADEGNEEEPVTYDLPDHTVTVTNLESSDLYGDVRIGDNRADDNEQEDDSSIADEIERGRTTDSDKRRLKALDRQMGDCSVQLRAALHKDKKQRGKMRRIKLRTTKKAKLARTHRL